MRLTHQGGISDGAGLQHTVLESSSKKCEVIVALVLQLSACGVNNVHLQPGSVEASTCYEIPGTSTSLL